MTRERATSMPARMSRSVGRSNFSNRGLSPGSETSKIGPACPEGAVLKPGGVTKALTLVTVLVMALRTEETTADDCVTAASSSSTGSGTATADGDVGEEEEEDDGDIEDELAEVEGSKVMGKTAGIVL